MISNCTNYIIVITALVVVCECGWKRKGGGIAVVADYDDTGIIIYLRTVIKNTIKLATTNNSDSKSNMASSARIIQTNSAWFQKKINLRPQHRGVHLVTEEILRQIPELSQFAMGLCHVQSKDSSRKRPSSRQIALFRFKNSSASRSIECAH